MRSGQLCAIAPDPNTVVLGPDPRTQAARSDICGSGPSGQARGQQGRDWRIPLSSRALDAQAPTARRVQMDRVDPCFRGDAGGGDAVRPTLRCRTRPNTVVLGPDPRTQAARSDICGSGPSGQARGQQGRDWRIPLSSRALNAQAPIARRVQMDRGDPYQLNSRSMPASFTPVKAEASSDKARRSSTSRLCTVDLPQDFASSETSMVMAVR